MIIQILNLAFDHPSLQHEQAQKSAVNVASVRGQEIVDALNNARANVDAATQVHRSLYVLLILVYCCVSAYLSFQYLTAVYHYHVLTCPYKQRDITSILTCPIIMLANPSLLRTRKEVLKMEENAVSGQLMHESGLRMQSAMQAKAPFSSPPPASTVSSKTSSSTASSPKEPITPSIKERLGFSNVMVAKQPL